MLLKRGVTYLLALLYLLGSPSYHALASGSYAGRPPRPPDGKNRVQYTQGKGIFTGKTELSEVGDSAQQLVLLEDWQTQLPAKVQSRTSLRDMAGLLTEEQLSALGYYLGVRYKVKINMR